MIRVQFRANHNVSSSRETKYMSLFRGGTTGGSSPLRGKTSPRSPLLKEGGLAGTLIDYSIPI